MIEMISKEARNEIENEITKIKAEMKATQTEYAEKIVKVVQKYGGEDLLLLKDYMETYSMRMVKYAKYIDHLENSLYPSY